jgi:hypothetical protein
MVIEACTLLDIPAGHLKGRAEVAIDALVARKAGPAWSAFSLRERFSQGKMGDVELVDLSETAGAAAKAKA